MTTEPNRTQEPSTQYAPPARPQYQPSPQAPEPKVEPIPPRLRGNAYFHNTLSAGAKFLFAALTDLSFLHKFGGTGTGGITTSCRRLGRILKHKRHSIQVWRTELVEAQLIRLEGDWPYSTWRIVGLAPGLNGEFDPRAFDLAAARGMTSGQITGAPSAPPELDPVTAAILEKHSRGEKLTSIEGGKLGNWKSRLNRYQRGQTAPPPNPAPNWDPDPGLNRTQYGPETGPNGDPNSDPMGSPEGTQWRPAMGPSPGPQMGPNPGQKTDCSGSQSGSPLGPVSGLHWPPKRVSIGSQTGSGVQETPRSFGVLETEGGAVPPPDAALQMFLNGLEGMFPSQLRKLADDLKQKLRSAQSDGARSTWKARLQAVEDKLLGGRVADQARPQAPTVAPTIARPELTPQEILEGALYLESTGKIHLATEEQREALKRYRLEQPQESKSIERAGASSSSPAVGSNHKYRKKTKGRKS